MPLHELVYVSLANHEFSDQELCKLLEDSRARNRGRGITGLLIYRAREFMQLIEGEEADVMALYERIERDPRHGQLHRIWDGSISTRSCGSWAMAFAQPHEATLHALAEGHQILDEGLFAAGRSSAGKRILMLLRDEVQQQQEAAEAGPMAVPDR